MSITLVCVMCSATVHAQPDLIDDTIASIKLPAHALSGSHTPPDQGERWEDAQQLYVYAHAPGIEARVRVEIGPLGARAWMADASSTQVRATWHVWSRGVHQYAHVAIRLDTSEGRRHAQAHVVVLQGAHQVHHALRDGPLFVHPQGIQWRCPAGAVKLCRRAILPKSYASDVPVDMVFLELGELKTPGQARRQARLAWSQEERLKGIPLSRSTSTRRGYGKQGWGKAIKVAEQWVFCGAHTRTGLGAKQFNRWRAQTIALCNALRSTPERATRDMCRQGGDACVRECGQGNGAACRALALGPGRSTAARAQYLTLGCQHGDALACMKGASTSQPRAMARACMLGHAQGCMQAKGGRNWMRACLLGDPGGCVLAARRSRLRQALLERACLLGSWDVCGE